MTEFFKLETKDNIAILTLDVKDRPLNVLSEKVLREFNQHLDHLIADTQNQGLVITSGKKDSFIAGADISEIESLDTVEKSTQGSKQMQAFFSKLAAFPRPTVAAINGICLGGGLEMSLACTWRIGTDNPKTKLGLPEVMLGLLPGAGGTQRLPRLVGLAASLDLILTGKEIPAKKAEKIGLLDAVVDQHILLKEAIKLAHKSRGDGRRHDGISKELPRWVTDHNPIGRSFVAKKTRDMLDKNTKGLFPAPYKALDAVMRGFDKSIEEGLDIESQLFGELAQTKESKSFIHLYHATTALKKNPYTEAGKTRFGDTKTNLVGIIGAGFMGRGVATVCAQKNIHVRYSDPDENTIGLALKHTRAFFNKLADRKRIKRFEVEQKMALVSPGTNPQGLGSCDVVIEAVFEDLNLKRKILAGFENKVSEDWIFASNTSALPISDISEGSPLADRVLGMHFFSPVEKMPLLEIVRTDKTAPWALARAAELGNTMGKKVIIVNDGPGFYTTRALAFYLAEAALMLNEGVKIETVDKALTKFGYPVGPITLIDEVGIDVGIHVLETIHKAFPDRMKMPSGLEQVQKSGRLGRKNGKGFYLYSEGKKTGPDSEIYNVAGPAKDDFKVLPTEEIIDRCNLVFVNESFRCLEEGILASSSDGDVGAVFGLGFPPFLGGPFHYVKLLGKQVVIERLEALAEKYGSRFEPCQSLRNF